MGDHMTVHENAKTEQLKQFHAQNADGKLTDDAGRKISEDGLSLRAGQRGPTLFQDTHFYKNNLVLIGNAFQRR